MLSFLHLTFKISLFWISKQQFLNSENCSPFTQLNSFFYIVYFYTEKVIKMLWSCRHNDGQMKSFFVGGPNQRKDYHIEEGEEVCIIYPVWYTMTKPPNKWTKTTEQQCWAESSWEVDCSCGQLYTVSSFLVDPKSMEQIYNTVETWVIAIHL